LLGFGAEQRHSLNCRNKLNRQKQVADLKMAAIRCFSFERHTPEIDAQLHEQIPSLLKNEEFLEAHPQTSVFYRSKHPQVSDRKSGKIHQVPYWKREKAFRCKTSLGARPTRTPTLTRQQVSTMDQFLDKNQNM